MKLPFFLNFDKKKPTFFLVLVLRNEKASAVIFKEEKAKVQVVGEHEEYFQNSIDNTSLEEFLDLLDRTISKAEGALPESLEIKKTVFGVKEDWVENDKIKKEHLLKLKKASDELGLAPIGFLIIPQAISYLLQKEEGVPLSAILVDAGKKFITASLIRSGRTIETRSAKIENSISNTVDNLLKHFTVEETLPSRIVIFNGQRDLSQEFISHQWSKSLPFLHLPQIVNLNVGFEAKAVLHGVATQMGFEVLEESAPGKTEIEEHQRPEFENLPMENFGFAKDTDIAKTTLPAASLGEPAAPASLQGEPSRPAGGPALTKTASEQVRLAYAARKTLVAIFQTIKKINMGGLLPSLSFPTINKRIIFIPILLMLLLLGPVLFYLFGTQATVFLDIKPKIIKQNNSIIFSTTLSTNEDNGIIGGEFVSVSLDGSVSTPTTGKKEIGNKAKGAVTVFNNTNTSKTFPKGTIITSSNGLDFTLDDSVTVASASGDVFSGTTPGKAKVDVVASKIGGEFNLPSNTKFSIGDNPLIAAKNDDPFSGGTKKEVSVVSKNDIDSLLQDLPKKLVQKAKDELAKKTSSDKTILPVLLATTVDKKNFDKDVDDQAETITLKGTVVYNALSYNKKDLISQSVSLIKKNVAMDQILDEDNIKIDIKDIKQKNEKEVDASLSIEAILKPKIDEKKLIDAITGKPYKDAKQKLMSIPYASNVSISSSLDIPFLPKMLPRISKNIKIKVIHE